MHIPDGFLDLRTTIATNVVSVGLLVYGVRKVNRTLTPSRVPLLGVSAAFVFTVQLISFPVVGGTSVHLVGGTLISVLLGPFSGFVVTTSALMLQAILFQHGGITSLGANILNIAFTSCVIGYVLYRVHPTWILAAISSGMMVILGSFLCATELYVSGKMNLKVAMISMISAHIAVAVVEATATYIILLTIHKVRPDLHNISKV